MSFSGEVKEELLRQMSPRRHCQIAELAAILSYGAEGGEEGQSGLSFVTDSEGLARKVSSLAYKVAREHITPEVLPVSGGRRKTGRGNRGKYVFSWEEQDTLLRTLKLMNRDGGRESDAAITSRLLIQRECCKRAFLRGAFLVCGTVSDPKSAYQLEYICDTEHKAAILKECLQAFHIEAKVTARRQSYIVYIKESESIVDLLGLIGAHVALMELENVRILKEIGNSVNRQVNCETANLNKTISASVRQREDIQYLMDHGLFAGLPAGTREIAELRLMYPDSSLVELGQMLDPPVGKSGVNHRLRKISELAEKSRASK